MCLADYRGLDFLLVNVNMKTSRLRLALLSTGCSSFVLDYSRSKQSVLFKSFLGDFLFSHLFTTNVRLLLMNKGAHY